MTEEERIAAEEAAKQREDELIEQLAKSEEDKANLVDSIKEERSKKGDAQKELEELKGKQTPPTEEDDPEKVVERVLTRRQEQESEANMETALEDFKRSVPEFSPETDAAGLVFRKFEQELKKFNLGGLNSKEQFNARFKEVHAFMNREKKETKPSDPYHQGTPPGTGSAPAEDDTATLNDAESKLIRDLGWDKARFLEAKAKRPHYVASLLKLRS